MRHSQSNLACLTTDIGGKLSQNLTKLYHRLHSTISGTLPTLTGLPRPRLRSPLSRLIAMVGALCLSMQLIIHVAGAQSTQSTSSTTAGKLIGVSPEIPFPDWFTLSFLDLVEDAEEAASENKHVMLYFHLNGCPYCYQMAMESFVESPYTDFIQDNFLAIELNWEGSREVVLNETVSLPEKELVEYLGATATPSVIFLDETGKPIYRVDGYRDVETFKHIMDFIAGKHYLDRTFQAYAASLDREQIYTPATNDSIINAADTTVDLSDHTGAPLMLLFESPYCQDCADFQRSTLDDEAVQSLLEEFIIYRIDPSSEAQIIDFDGNQTTLKSLTAALEMTDYEPGVLLYKDNKIRRRIDHKLFRFHFLESLRWTLNEVYLTESDFFDYIDARTADMMTKGQSINIAE